MSQPQIVTKLLLIGDSGGGKTGALCSLIKAGYNLRMLDFDNGSEIIYQLTPPELHHHLSIIPIQDHREARKLPIYGEKNVIKGYTVRAVPKKADAWQRAMNLLFDWKDPSTGEILGSIYDWTPQDIIVIDSLSHAWRSAMIFVQSINNTLGNNPSKPEWGACQQCIIDLLAALYDAAVNCNVIVCAHIGYSLDQNDILRGLPAGPGIAINKDIPTYFNHILRAATVGRTHRLLVESDGTVETKTSAPGKVKKEYSVETGLAEYFRDLRSQTPAEPSK